jgi:pyrimidine-nucleoside phosphorylase
MPKAEHKIEIISKESGFVSHLDAMAVAETAKMLGAGRDKKEDEIDLGVGVELKAKRGNRVNKGDVLAIIHANSLKNIQKTLKKIESAFEFSNVQPEPQMLIREVIN